MGQQIAYRYLAVALLCCLWSTDALAEDAPAPATTAPAAASPPPSPAAPELSTILMESTFRVHGQDRDKLGSNSFGTAFLVGKPTADPARQYYVLITAAHVLDKIAGDYATLTLREKQPSGVYTLKPWPVKLRNAGVPLYVKHKESDVAALYVNMPDEMNVAIVPVSLLANDEALQRFEIHPGDELLCLGFPLFVSSEFGFPILRSGKIASYPIIPTSVHKNILFDFRVFEGNSGGPVYFVANDRTYGGLLHPGERIQFIVGLVTSQLGSKLYNNQLIQLAQVVPSSYIRETIDLLPATSPYK